MIVIFQQVNTEIAKQEDGFILFWKFIKYIIRVIINEVHMRVPVNASGTYIRFFGVCSLNECGSNSAAVKWTSIYVVCLS